MFNKKKIIIIIGILITIILIYIFTPKVESYFRWQRAARASASFPYQIGLTGAVLSVCTNACLGKCCPEPTGMCIDGKCSGYTAVQGSPSGGSGDRALFLNTTITQVGLTPGGQLIAGGMGAQLMDSGVLASDGGCSGSGCALIETGPMERFQNWIYSYIIAGMK